MTPPHTPEAIGRAHALQRLAECALTLARLHTPGPSLEPADAAYQRAYVEACEHVAEQLRKAKGVTP